MAINGSLDEASLADVLQLLSLGRKTGRLSVSDQSNLGHIYLDTGKITHAFLVNRHHRLGDILFKSGHITQDQLNEAIRLQEKNPEKKVGEILVETGATSESELGHYMQVQIEEAVYFLFTWRRGDFAFERDVTPDPEDFLVSINPESLLLEGARRVDEWSVIEKKIPSFDMVFAVNHERLESSDARLSNEQKRVASMLDGKRDVAALVAATGMIEFDVGQSLYGLITAGFAEAVGPSGVQSPAGSNGENGTGHLDREKLLAYLTHEAEFADEERHRHSGLHIADCPTCSKRLQEIHTRRSQGLSAIPDEADETMSEPAEHLSERRGKSDRRQSGTAPSFDQDLDRRVHGAGDRRSSTRAAAVQGRSSREERQIEDRRSAVRRKRKRRSAAPVDRSDRVAVERRREMERRLQERRSVPRRTADVTLQAVGSQRSAASQQVGAGISIAAGKASKGTTSGGASTVRRDTVSVRSAKAQDFAGDGSSTPLTSSHHNGERESPGPDSDQTSQQEPVVNPPESVPADPPQKPTRPSVRRMRESPLRGLPLLADGTQWMFVERVDSDAEKLESESRAPASKLPTQETIPTIPPADDSDTKPAPSHADAKTTVGDIAIPSPRSRTTGVDITTPELTSKTPDLGVEEPKSRTSKWRSRAKPQDPEVERAKLELAKAKSEAEKAKLEATKVKTEAERAKAEAERVKSQAEKAKSQAEKAKSETEKAKSEAEKARSEAEKAAKAAEKAEANAEKATTKAESVKSDAARRKSEAVLTKSEAKKAQLEVAKAKSEAEKAKQEARRAKAEAEEARLEAEEATTIADKIKLEADEATTIADRVRAEAETVRSEADQVRLEAEKAKSEAIRRKSEAKRAQLEITKARSEAEKAKQEARRAKAEAEEARLEAEEATTIADKIKLKADEATTIADRVRVEAETVRSEADQVRLEAEKTKSEAERTKLEAEKAKSEAEAAASRPRRSLSGRGTPVTLRQLVGSSFLDRGSETPAVRPTHTHHSEKGASLSQKSRRTPVFWVTLAAATVMAMAAGWLVRPFLETGFGNRSVSANDNSALTAAAIQPSNEEAPIVISDTAFADSPAADRETEAMRPPPAASAARPAQIPVTETPIVESQTPRAAEIAPESAGLPSDSTPTPVQPRLEEPVVQPEPAAMPPQAPVSEQQPIDSAELTAAVVPAATISGSVREVGTGAPLPGARVFLSNTDITTITNATGSYSFVGVPTGLVTVAVELDGYMSGNETVTTEAGDNIELNVTLRGPPSAREPDEELDDGQWAVTNPAGAAAALGRPVAVISDLWVESLARPASGTRPRVRVAHLTESGERITMIVSRSGPATSAAQPQVTALRIVSPTEAYPITTGTANFGGLLVTAKATMPAESLRALLQRLVEADGG